MKVWAVYLSLVFLTASSIGYWGRTLDGYRDGFASVMIVLTSASFVAILLYIGSLENKK